MEIEHINFWAVLVAAIIKFFIGGLWYSPLLFGERWMREVGLKKEELGSPTRPMMIAAGLGLVAALTLAVIIGLGNLNLSQSIALGCLTSLGLVATQLATNFAFEDRSFKLWAIYAGQYTVEFSVMAAIIGYWR